MFKIITDSTADLPLQYLSEHNVECMNLSYILDGETYGHGKELPCDEFYALMRQGKMPTTSQVNPEEAKVCFEKNRLRCGRLLCGVLPHVYPL